MFLSVVAYLCHVSVGQFLTVRTPGSYNITVDGEVWLQSADTIFRVAGKAYSTSDGSLKLLRQMATSGVDVLGHFDASNYSFAADGREVDAIIRTYSEHNVVIFSQVSED